MRAAPLLALLAAACSPAEEARGGIVSLNPCADQLLLALVPPARIAAISHYSRDPAATSIPLAVARRLRATAGTAEEVIALSPDLVVATSFTQPATRAAFARAGLRVVYLGSPTTVAGSRAQVGTVARVVGAEARGRELVGRIDAAVREARPYPASVPSEPSSPFVPSAVEGRASSGSPGPRASTSLGTNGSGCARAWTDAGCPAPSALLFITGDLASGEGTLLHELMTLAHLRDAAADYGLAGTGTLPVETIVARPPAAILQPEGTARTAALRARVLAATGARTRTFAFPRRLINCGGPTIPAALERLRAIRARL